MGPGSGSGCPIALCPRRDSSQQTAGVGTGLGSKPIWPLTERRWDAHHSYSMFLSTGSSTARAEASSSSGLVAGGIWWYGPRWQSPIPSPLDWRVVGSGKCHAFWPVPCCTAVQGCVWLLHSMGTCWALPEGQFGHGWAIPVTNLKYSKKGMRCFAMT